MLSGQCKTTELRQRSTQIHSVEAKVCPPAGYLATGSNYCAFIKGKQQVF